MRINNFSVGDKVRVLVQPHCVGYITDINLTTGVFILNCPQPEGTVHVHWRHVIHYV